MAEPHWTSYVGMITGIVGSLTGIAGAIMGYVSYRKSSQIKVLDLRIEVKRAVTNTIFAFNKLQEQMEKGNNSRKAVAAAIGMFNSGMMKKWKEELEADRETVNEIGKELPDENENYDNFNAKELETKLIELHGIQKKIQKISEKYSEAMIWDNERRKQHQADIHSRLKP